MLARVPQPEPGPAPAFAERANLYPLSIVPPPRELFIGRGELEGRMREIVSFDPRDGAGSVAPSFRSMRQALRRLISSALVEAGYLVQPRFCMVVDTTRNYAPEGTPLRICSSFVWRILACQGSYYLCLDHRLKVQPTLSLARILANEPDFPLLPSQPVLYRLDGEWCEGKLLTLEDGVCWIGVEGDEIAVPVEDIVPRLNRAQLARYPAGLGIRPEALDRQIKQLSFLLGSKAPLARLEATTAFARRLADTVFPLSCERVTVHLEPTPAALRPPSFFLGHDLVEPRVSFDHIDRSKRAEAVTDGLIDFGAYDRSAAPLRLLLLAPRDRVDQMRRLVRRLNEGSRRYPGAESTFGSNLVIAHSLECHSIDEYAEVLRTFVRGPARAEVEAALVYLPRAGNPLDFRHPYFRIKGLLAGEGLVSQMVDEATVRNPDWRDLNLALNVYAKAGYVPWVLDEPLPHVDLFIGLSSSIVYDRGHPTRMMAFVNVFDRYGRWRFYQGDTVAFAFEERFEQYGELIRNSLAAHRGETGQTPHAIHIHQTKAFSAQERAVLIHAIRQLLSDVQVTFVHVNADHAVRLYDLSSPDGRIPRSTYLWQDPGRLYLATTGQNIFHQPGMGTPVPLELTMWNEPQDAALALTDIAQHVLSLTRLNWASSRSFCHEPITTKFAGRIAYLMSAFMREPALSVNSLLRSVPWFL